MGPAELGPWEPLPLRDAVASFTGAPLRWWVSGGRALELHLQRSWRDHDDLDIGIVRGEAPILRAVLEGWDIHIASGGVLTPWDGGPLDPGGSQGNLWCRPSPGSAWALDVTVGAGDETDWIYRRDPTVRRSWSEAVLVDEEGVPYLAPELQLVFKSTAIRPKDEVDANEVIPELEPGRRAWLAAHLPSSHPWRAIIG